MNRRQSDRKSSPTRHVVSEPGPVRHIKCNYEPEADFGLIIYKAMVDRLNSLQQQCLHGLGNQLQVKSKDDYIAVIIFMYSCAPPPCEPPEVLPLPTRFGECKLLNVPNQMNRVWQERAAE